MSFLTHTVYKEQIGGVQTSMSASTIQPFFSLAERELKKRVGAAVYDHVTGEAPSDEGEAAIWAELKTLCQGWGCWYAHSLAFPHMKFRFGDLGMMKNSPQNAIAITKWEYVDSVEANLEMQDVFLELIWELLETEAPEFWTVSDVYKSRQKHFIRSAAELASFVPAVGKSSRFYERLQVYVARAEELYISELLTDEVFDGLLTKWVDRTPFSTTEKKMVDLIQKATAHLAVFEAYPYLPLKLDENGVRQIRSKDGVKEEEYPEKRFANTQRRQLYQDGELYVGKLKALLMKTATTTVYPTFYEKYLTPENQEAEEDFTESSHIIL